MSSYTVHRSEKSPENPYAQISREMAQDSRLSFQSRGLMLYILSKPRQWKGKSADLQREGHIKEKALKTMLDELMANGYIVRQEIRRQGRFDYKLEVFEEPGLSVEVSQPEECLTVPPSGGGGADPPSRPPRDVGAVHIDSTQARAFSSITRREEERPAHYAGKELKTKEALFAIDEVQNSDVFSGLESQLSVFGLDFAHVYHQWWLKYFRLGGIGRRAGSKATARQYAASLEAYFSTWARNEAGRNGGSNSNGHKKNSDDRPIWMASKK